jgi:hypothetical protein
MLGLVSPTNCDGCTYFPEHGEVLHSLDLEEESIEA